MSNSGVFACQRDSYLKELKTQVVSCKPASIKAVKGFDVTFADTILFPEGGGQNDDHGTVNGLPVRRVIRKDGTAVHFIESGSPLNPGDEVEQRVDWMRRFDHMQQHSGQHLISAIFENNLDMPTLSWWMAENDGKKVGISFIELGVDNVSQDNLAKVEDICNEMIRQHLDMVTQVFEKDAEELKTAKTRGLPADHQGPVRVVKIGDIDSNMCCGTHVSNLSELQMIKLLHCEKSKRKGNCNVYFLVGNRVSQYFSQCYQREREFTSLLNGGPEDHYGLVEKAAKNAKKYQKFTQSLLKELAVVTAQELKDTKPKFYSTHRQENEMDFCSTLLNELSNEDITLFVSSGNDKEGPCQLVLSSSEETIKHIGPKIMETLEAKGGGKGRRLNGKFTSLKNRDKVDEILEDFFKLKAS